VARFIQAHGCVIAPSDFDCGDNNDDDGGDGHRHPMGLRVLLPYIFEYLHGVIRKVLKRKDASMPTRKLVMLSTLSPFIASDVKADTIIRILLPLLGKC